MLPRHAHALPGAGPHAAAAGKVLAPLLVSLGAAALGALQTLAFVQTSLWPLPILSLTALLALLQGATTGRAALLGWAYGTGWLCAGVWWLFISMHRYGQLPAPLAAAAVLALSAALSLYLAAAAAAYARWRSGRLGDALLWAGLFGLAELARGVFFTGFPWLSLGYSQLDAPLAGLAPWLGVYGIGLVAAALAAALLRLLVLASRGAWLRAGGVGLLMAGLLLSSHWAPRAFTQPSGEISVALLQGNVKQDEKFALEHLPAAMAWVQHTMTQVQADLVLGPETVVPLLPEQLVEFAPDLWPALVAHFSQPGRAALLGVPLGDLQRGYTNSVVGLSSAPPYRYDKLHLVPFGEFIPTGFRWFTELLNIPLGDFARGVPNPPSMPVKGQRVAPNICFEDLFGEELARRFVDPALAPSVLANVSNIGWFGQTVAVPQHLNISRMRTLELQRPMLRATNTGATAVIDHQGQVRTLLPPYTQGVLQARVQGREGITPFAWWAARVGLLPLWALATLLVLLGGALGSQQARRRAAGKRLGLRP